MMSEKSYNLLGKNQILFPQNRPKINEYHCEGGHTNKTIDRDVGVMPMFIRCERQVIRHGKREKCNRSARSQFYKVPQTAIAEFEFYRPPYSEYLKMSPELQDHIEQGGLLFRKIAILAEGTNVNYELHSEPR